MTISVPEPSPSCFCMYVVAAERQARGRSEQASTATLWGTLQTDIFQGDIAPP